MISSGTFIVRCDGKDRATNDTCKSGSVIDIPIMDLRLIPINAGHAQMAHFFIKKVGFGWTATCEGKVFCPLCKPNET